MEIQEQYLPQYQSTKSLEIQSSPIGGLALYWNDQHEIILKQFSEVIYDLDPGCRQETKFYQFSVDLIAT